MNNSNEDSISMNDNSKEFDEQEYISTFGEMPQDEFDAYWSKQSKNNKVRIIKVNYTLEDDLKRGAMLAKDYLKNW